jgi:hypothetical protein
MRRVMDALGGLGCVMSRHAARNGHASSVKPTTSSVVTRTNADDTSAKPAPGPM